MLGSCLLIWARGEGAGRLLALRPMVWIGLISYSLYLRRRRASFLFAADADCPIGLDFDIDPSVTPAVTSLGHYRRCGEYNSAMLEQAMQPQIKTVVLSSRWTNWRISEPANAVDGPVDIRLRTSAGTAPNVAANRAIFERGFTRLVGDLHAAGKRVVIVGPLPEPPYDVPRRAYVSHFGFVAPPANLTDAEYYKRHAVILAFSACWRARRTSPGLSERCATTGAARSWRTVCRSTSITTI